MRKLAVLHKVMRGEIQNEYVRESLVHECDRHNAEIRKTRKFIQKKQKKNGFEVRLLNCAELFLRQGEQVVQELENSDYEILRKESLNLGSICHGDYNQHNVLFNEMCIRDRYPCFHATSAQRPSSRRELKR